MGGSGTSAARLTGQKMLERGLEEEWGVAGGSGHWVGKHDRRPQPGTEAKMRGQQWHEVTEASEPNGKVGLVVREAGVPSR